MVKSFYELGFYFINVLYYKTTKYTCLILVTYNPNRAHYCTLLTTQTA